MGWPNLNGPTEVVALTYKKTLDSKFYCKNVLPIVKRNGNALIGNNFTFQQDGASNHTSKKTSDEINRLGISSIPFNIWPPNSQDLNPLDYFFWNEIEIRLKQKNFNSHQELVDKINECVKEVPLKMIQEAISQFRSRVHAVLVNKGELFLNKNFQ